MAAQPHNNLSGGSMLPDPSSRKFRSDTEIFAFFSWGRTKSRVRQVLRYEVYFCSVWQRLVGQHFHLISNLLSVSVMFLCIRIRLHLAYNRHLQSLVRCKHFIHMKTSALAALPSRATEYDFILHVPQICL